MTSGTVRANMRPLEIIAVFDVLLIGW